MKKLLFLLLLCCPLLQGQQVKGVITTTQCIQIATDQKATVYLQVTGGWSGTIQPKVTIDGQAYVNVQVTPSTSSTAQNTITANGAYFANVAGYSLFTVCGATVATAPANVFLNTSPAAQ